MGYLKKSVVFFIFLIFIILFLGYVNSQLIFPLEMGDKEQKNELIITKYTPSTKTTCSVEGICTKRLYSGTMFVEEDGIWKDYEDARSLNGKGFDVIYLENDKDYPIEVVDFNATSITIKPNPDSKLDYSKDTLLRIWEFDEAKSEQYIKDIDDGKIIPDGIEKDYKEIYTKIEESIVTKEDLNNKDIQTYPFGLNKILEFGENSTTIILQDADVDNLGDARVIEQYPDTNYGENTFLVLNGQSLWNNDFYVMFNLSLANLSSNWVLLSADLSLYYYTVDSFNEGDDGKIYHVLTNITDWNETSITWNNQPCGVNFTNTTACVETGEVLGLSGVYPRWINTDITNELNNSLNYGWENISFGVFHTGSSLSTYYRFHSKEYTDDISLRPSLDIIYQDTNLPLVFLKYPNGGYSSPIYNITYTCNITDKYGLSNVTLYIWNSSDDEVFTNTTSVSGFVNSTIIGGSVSMDGEYYWNCYAFNNETFADFSDFSNVIYFETNYPAITLNYPENNTYFNESNIFFNFTAIDENGLGECSLYGNWSDGWHKNYTWYSPTNNTMNYTNLTIPEGKFFWNILCNDTGGNAGFFMNNYTYIVDETNPYVNITNIGTNVNSQNINFNFTVFDVNQESCNFSIYNSSDDVEGVYSNISIVCGSNNTLATVSDYGDFNLVVYSTDKAGNTNHTTKIFTTVQSSPSGGGGGGNAPPSSDVIGLIQPFNITEFNNLSRAIIYAEIRRSCNEKDSCILDNEQKNELIITLSLANVILPLDELDRWLDAYNEDNLEVSKILDSQIKEYNLFTGILQIDSGDLIANPSRLDPFPPYIIWFGTKNPVFRTKIRFNKILNSSWLLGDSDLELSIEQTDTEAVILLNITEFSYASKVYRGVAGFTSSEGDVTYVDINLRVINLNNAFTLISTSIILGGFILIGVYRKKLKLNKLTKKIDKKLDKIIKA